MNGRNARRSRRIAESVSEARGFNAHVNYETQPSAVKEEFSHFDSEGNPMYDMVTKYQVVLTECTRKIYQSIKRSMF